jgi:hypothetical protein
VRCVLDCGYPLSSAEGGAFFLASRAGRSPASAPRSGAGGGAQGGERPRTSEFCAVAVGGRGPLGLPGGPNGPKNGCFAALSGTRSRQDESKEVHEVFGVQWGACRFAVPPDMAVVGGLAAPTNCAYVIDRGHLQAALAGGTKMWSGVVRHSCSVHLFASICQ